MTVDLARLRAAHARARAASPYAEDVEEYADLVATYLPALLNDLETLRAEVARTREHPHIRLCIACGQRVELFCSSRSDAADREREAIVAWLRGTLPNLWHLDTASEIASALERGDHHAERSDDAD